MRKLLAVVVLAAAGIGPPAQAVGPGGCIAYGAGGTDINCNYTFANAGSNAGFLAVGLGCFTVARNFTIVGSGCSVGESHITFTGGAATCPIGERWDVTVTTTASPPNSMTVIAGCAT